MRILHIDTGRQMRGGQRQVLLLMRGLREAGHECILLARKHSALWDTATEAGFGLHSATAAALWTRSMDADLVHAHDARAHTLAAVWSRRKFVVSRRVAFSISPSFLSRWKYRRAARFLAVSQFVAGKLGEAGIPAQMIHVVFDGVELFPTAVSWDPANPVVALASSDPQKGRDLVERAAHKADVEVIYSSNLAHDLPRASLFVYISRSEGFGSAALLAMSMGVPVVASKVGGLTEAFEDGVSGIAVENDPDRIAAAIRQVLDTLGLAPALIGAARKRVESCFTQQHLVERTLAAYRRALAG